MRAVWSLMRACFGQLPLQHWMNGVGAAILAFGAFLAVAENPPNAVLSTLVLGGVGMLLIVVIPLTSGGLALRYASSSSMLHLRPHGRLRMALAATATIALIAMLCALPFVAIEQVALHRGSVAMSEKIAEKFAPLDVFSLAWTTTTAIWIGSFAASSSRSVYRLFGLIPMIMVFGGRWVTQHWPGALPVLAAGIAAWSAFLIWYWSAANIRAPVVVNTMTPMGFGESALPLGSAVSGPVSREAALRQYLLGSSLPNQLLVAVCLLAFMLLTLSLMGTPPGRKPSMYQSLEPMRLLGILSFYGGSIGFMLARRARMLWLRAGVDRPALFALAERDGVRATGITMGCVALGLGAWSVAADPTAGIHILIAAMAYLILALCVFYAGMALTRAWRVRDVLLGIGMLIVTILVSVAHALLVREGHTEPLATVLWLALPLAALSRLLRWYARRNWAVVDWRVARMRRVAR